MIAQVAVLLFTGCVAVMALPVPANNPLQLFPDPSNILQNGFNPLQSFQSGAKALVGGLQGYPQQAVNQAQKLSQQVNGQLQALPEQAIDQIQGFPSQALENLQNTQQMAQQGFGSGLDRLGKAYVKTYNDGEQMVDNTLKTIQGAGEKTIQAGTKLFRQGLGMLFVNSKAAKNSAQA